MRRSGAAGIISGVRRLLGRGSGRSRGLRDASPTNIALEPTGCRELRAPWLCRLPVSIHRCGDRSVRGTAHWILRCDLPAVRARSLFSGRNPLLSSSPSRQSVRALQTEQWPDARTPIPRRGHLSELGGYTGMDSGRVCRCDRHQQPPGAPTRSTPCPQGADADRRRGIKQGV